MTHSVTAEEVISTVKHMPSSERARFFTLLGISAFQSQDFTHEQVFGDLHSEQFSSTEAAEYLEVSISTFRRYVQAGKINPVQVVGRNQFFAPKDLKAIKRSLRAVKG